MGHIVHITKDTPAVFPCLPSLLFLLPIYWVSLLFCFTCEFLRKPTGTTVTSHSRGQEGRVRPAACTVRLSSAWTRGSSKSARTTYTRPLYPCQLTIRSSLDLPCAASDVSFPEQPCLTSEVTPQVDSHHDFTSCARRPPPRR